MLAVNSKRSFTNSLTLACALLNWITHFYICSIVGSYYHVISLAIILFIYWGHNGLRILILLANYVMNVHIFCHYYEALNSSSISLIFISSIMLIIIAFVKLYTARKVFMETCFTTTIIFYILLNFYIFVYYMFTYYSVDTYYSLDKLFISLSLWMICCWNVNINDVQHNNLHHNSRLTITAIVGIISQGIFLLRFIPFIIEYNKNDVPLIILIILCIHIGSILIIFLSIDLSNELQLKLTTNINTISFGFSLILSIWVEYLLVIFYFAIYFVMHYASASSTETVAPFLFNDYGIATDLGRYNFILLSIPGSIPWTMIMFANYRRDSIYHHMLFTEIFDNYNNKIPVHSFHKISDVLVRCGVGKSIIPLPKYISQHFMIDSIFALVCLFGYEHNANDEQTKSSTPSRILNKQYNYLKIEKRKHKTKFVKNVVKKYIESHAVKISTMYNLIFYHENVALFLSICFLMSRFVSCILIPFIWFVMLRDVDNESILSLELIQNWIIYVILVLYLISFLPFIYNIYCILHCGYYFFLISPIKISGRHTLSITHDGKWNADNNILPQLVQNTKRNKAIWSCLSDKNIAIIIILFLPNVIT